MSWNESHFLIIYIEGGLMVSSEYKKGIFLAFGIPYYFFSDIYDFCAHYRKKSTERFF